MDKISIIIPAYNAEKTIGRCLESLLQGDDNIQPFYKEIIVINDGSIDKTEEIVQEYSKGNNGIVLITQDNLGVAVARNTGLRHATGNFIAWCDADDYVEPEWLPNLYCHLKEHNADISVCRAKIAGRSIEYNPNEYIVWNKTDAINQFIIHNRFNGILWNKLFRKELFDGVEFIHTMTIFEDDYVIWQLLQKVNVVVWYNEGTYNYSVSSNSLSNSSLSNEKVASMLYLWDTIINDCRKYYPNFLSLALNKRYQATISMYFTMMKVGLVSQKYEAYMRAIIAESGIRSALKLSGIVRKLLALCVFFSPRFCRLLFTLVFRKSRR